MEPSIFGWIGSLSPWWWIALGIAIGALEMATGSFFLIWPALAALCVAALVALIPDLSGEAIIVLFATLAIILTFAGRALLTRFGDGGAPASGLNQRSDAMVGRRAKVLDHADGEGWVEIDGIRWKAIWANPPASPPKSARIDRAEGMTLYVSSPA